MERRTSRDRLNLSLGLGRWALALVLTLGGVTTLRPAYSAGVMDPDDAYPVSRFGTSNRGPALRGPAAVGPAAVGPAAMSGDEEESRGRDEITNQRVSRNSVGQQQAAPLGTLRRNGLQEVALIAGDLGFFPRTVFVTRDVPVRMYVTGASKNSLCILMDSFQVRKQVKSQKIEEVSFTPTQPGRFRFYCPINGAEGYMVVREFERADGG